MPGFGVSNASYFIGQRSKSQNWPTAFTTTPKQFQARKYHVALEPLPWVQLSYPNWFMQSAGSTFIETGTGGTATITSGVEYAGVTLQALWAGLASTTAATLTDTDLCDRVYAGIPAAGVWFCRPYYANAAGIVTNGLTVTANVKQSVNSAVGETMLFATSGLVDQSTATGVPTIGAAVGAQSSVASAYGPAAVIGPGYGPSVLLLGDSIQTGLNASYSGASGDRGIVGRTLGQYANYLNGGIPSDSAAKFVASHSRRTANSAYFTHVVWEYGSNDIALYSRTPAQLLADTITAAGYFPNAKFMPCTLIPRCTDQTTLGAFSASILAYNELLRAAASSFSGPIIDLADALDPLRTGLWYTDGAVNSITRDFVHPEANGELYVMASGKINPLVFTR